MRINATLVSVQSSPKPGYAYGQLASVPLKAADRAGLLRAAIPEDVPDTAIVTKAQLVFYARGAWSATSRTFSAQRNSDGWKVSKSTWNNKPGVSGTTKSVSVGATVEGTEFRIDVLDHVQEFVAGTATNRGWRITSSGTTSHSVCGTTAGRHKPWLDFEYVEPGEAPTDLSPSDGAVSVAKPTVTFATADDVLSIQVQIDVAADSVSPDWDSGEVPASAGLLNLASTTYPGLSTGTSTSWRARVKSSLGWSAWSDWATFSRVAKPPVTITSPGATTGDKTPPIGWTAPGQVSWHAQLLRGDTGVRLDDSSRTTSPDTDWTPTKGLKRVGDVGRAVVRVWDGVNRIATPGDPTYTEATLDFTLVALDDAPGVDVLTAVPVGPTPVVRLNWAGPLADYWRVTRDGDWVSDKLDGSVSEFFDYTAEPYAQHVYQVLPVTSLGEVSPNGPTATITPQPAGVWLMDPGTDEKLLILDATPETSMTEQAVLHTVVGDRPPVRRRSGTPPPSGTLSGFLLDSDATDFPAVLGNLTARTFKGNAQGHEYRLVMDGWNIPVTIGDMTSAPALLDHTGRPTYSVQFSWWQTRDEWDL